MPSEIPPGSVVAVTLAAFGRDLGLARRKRRLTMEEASRLAGVTRGTWARLEHGGPEVSIGVLARALDALGMLGLLAGAVDPGLDRVGLELEAGRVPARVRRRRGER